MAFDDVITGTAAVYTSAALNDRLGQSDPVAICVVLDNASGTVSTFDLFIEHSSDGRNWLQMNDIVQTSPPPETTGYGDINVGSIAAGTTLTKMYSDPRMGGITALANANVSGRSTGQWFGPLLAYVRFGMKLSGTSPSLHVKVYVTQRDW
jgi:hypothetical protein